MTFNRRPTPFTATLCALFLGLGLCSVLGAGIASRATAEAASPPAAVDPTANEFDDRVQGALEQLPDQLRETLLLVVVGELTHQEVADLLSIPIGTVLSRVSRARTRLRKLLVEVEVRNQ